MTDTYSISSTHLAGVLKQYWKKLTKKGIMAPYGLMKTLPTAMVAKRSGTTVNLTRYAELPDQTELITDEVTRPDYRALVTGKVTASIVTMVDNVAPSEIGELTSQDGLDAVPNLLIRQARRSLDRYAGTNLTAYFRMLRADLDTNYQVTSEATSDGASDGTTIIDTVLTEADDYWNGALVTLLDEEFNAIESRYVTDFTASSDTLTFGTAFSYQITDGVRYQITHFTGVADQATDKLDLDVLREAQILLHHSGYYGDGFEYEGGGYKIVLDSLNFGDITGDSDLITLFQNKEKESGLRKYGWGGPLLSIVPELTMRPFRCAVGGAGTYAGSGVCDIAAVLTKAAAMKMPLEKGDVEVIIKGKKEGGHANPAELFSTFAWKYKFAPALDKPSAAIGIVCGQNRATL